jgi:hypothetical protein
MDLASIPRIVLRALLASLVMLHAPLASFASLQSPTLDRYVSSYTEPGYKGPILHIKNNYKEPLVAAAWNFQCTATEGSAGNFDAVISLARPVQPGASANLGSETYDCGTGVNALIFSDGTEVGDPHSLKLLHINRVSALSELKSVLRDDILPVARNKWNLSATLAVLSNRKQMLLSVASSTPAQGRDVASRIDLLEGLSRKLNAFQQLKFSDSAAESKQKRELVAQLTNWEASLANSHYYWHATTP